MKSDCTQTVPKRCCMNMNMYYNYGQMRLSLNEYVTEWN